MPLGICSSSEIWESACCFFNMVGWKLQIVLWAPWCEICISGRLGTNLLLDCVLSAFVCLPTSWDSLQGFSCVFFPWWSKVGICRGQDLLCCGALVVKASLHTFSWCQVSWILIQCWDNIFFHGHFDFLNGCMCFCCSPSNDDVITCYLP